MSEPTDERLAILNCETPLREVRLLAFAIQALTLSEMRGHHEELIKAIDVLAERIENHAVNMESELGFGEVAKPAQAAVNGVPT